MRPAPKLRGYPSGATPMPETRALQVQSLKSACSQCSVLELCLPIGLSGDEVERLDKLIVQRFKVKKRRSAVPRRRPFALALRRANWFIQDLLGVSRWARAGHRFSNPRRDARPGRDQCRRTCLQRVCLGRQRSLPHSLCTTGETCAEPAVAATQSQSLIEPGNCPGSHHAHADGQYELG